MNVARITNTMRRAELLFQIAQYLRGRRLTTAHPLSEWLAVSERTIYRDIRDLSTSGMPIEGEAGVGYRVRAGFDLQPLMFSTDEIEAMVAGMRMVQVWGGPQLAASSVAALAKITLALPREKRDFVEATPLFAPDFHIDPTHGKRLECIRQAIGKQHKLHLDYIDAKQQATQRVIWPLVLYYWGSGWSIAAWCETRSDFRSFRLDRVQLLTSGERYDSVADHRLADFVRAMKRNSSCN